MVLASHPSGTSGRLSVRKIHRRDLNQVWEFLKEVFRSVNRSTVEYQRPRSKQRFFEVYDIEDVIQLVFEMEESGEPGKRRHKKIVGYAECAVRADVDSYLNPGYFRKRKMKPLFIEEIAVHPEYQGRGVGSYIMGQLEHLARVRGCTHLLLEAAENNRRALDWYRKRAFRKMDAQVILAKRLPPIPEVLPPLPVGGEGHVKPAELLAPAAAHDAIAPGGPTPGGLPPSVDIGGMAVAASRARKRAKAAKAETAEGVPAETAAPATPVETPKPEPTVAEASPASPAHAPAPQLAAAKG